MPSPQTTPAPRRQPRARARLIPMLGALAMLALLAGCSLGLDQAQVMRPSGPDSKPCREHCDLLKTQCQQRQENREKECAVVYNSAKADYDLCRAGGARGNCRAPYTCLGADLSICEREYAPCVNGCGAAVTERPGTGSGTAAPATDATTAKVDGAGGAGGAAR